MEPNKFINGLVVKKPSERAPEFIICNLSLKREELIQTLQGMEGEWINVDVKMSKAGKYYAMINDYKKDQPKEEVVVDNEAPF